MNENALRIENISKTFVSDSGIVPVLENINLEVKTGEFICIVGPSGCGKTTLLHILAGLESSDGGCIYYKGKRLLEAGPERLVILQELGLFPWLTVEKNVEFGLKIKKVAPKKRRAIVRDYLDMVNLLNFKDSFIHELSGGMKQRVALARALVIEPEILLMDEPFAALDAQTRDMLHIELQRIWEMTKKTILFVTHNVREAVCLADRVIALSAYPAKIINTYTIELLRPRHIEDPGLMEIVRPILGGLKSEIEKVHKKEFNG